jgi:glutaredoxin-like protein
MEKMLNPSVQIQINEVFEDLREPVAVIFFRSQAENCEYCVETRQLLEEVVSLSEKLSLEVYDLQSDAELAAKYHVDKAPGFVLAGKDGDSLVDFGIRYAGIPAGHEFSALIHDMVQVSKRDSGLSQPTRDFLKQLTQTVNLEVFVTPT